MRHGDSIKTGQKAPRVVLMKLITLRHHVQIETGNNETLLSYKDENESLKTFSSLFFIIHKV